MKYSGLLSLLFKRRASTEQVASMHENHFQVNCDYILPKLPDKDLTVDDQTDWITQCELTLGASLGIHNVYVALSPEMIGSNYALFKGMVKACNGISDCGGNISSRSIADVVLDGIPENINRAIMRYLFEFYLESHKLTFSSRRLCDWILSRRIENHATQAQLLLILYFTMSQYQDSHT